MDQNRALSFGARAEEYQRTRPGYPGALLDAFIEPAWRHIADVGAGTGKFTALLCARGLSVTAVEPDAGMRSVLAVTTPLATVLAGTGEAIPLPDASVDAVTFAQAWHWVDHERGLLEAARVLRPGGALVLIWNVRPDGSPSWVHEVDELTDSGAAVHDFDDAPRHPGFDQPTRFEMPWSESISREQLVERATTWSSVATLPDTDRADLLARLRTLLDTHPDLQDQELLTLPQTALAFRYQVSTVR